MTAGGVTQRAHFSTGPGALVVVVSPDRLRAACVARGWSLSELAARARVSRPTLRSALRGHPVRPRTAWKLARALHEAAGPAELQEILGAP